MNAYRAGKGKGGKGTGYGGKGAMGYQPKGGWKGGWKGFEGGKGGKGYDGKGKGNAMSLGWGEQGDQGWGQSWGQQGPVWTISMLTKVEDTWEVPKRTGKAGKDAPIEPPPGISR